MVTKPKGRSTGARNRDGRPPPSPPGEGKNRGGRPPLPEEGRRDTRIPVLTTEAEYAELQRAATYVGMSVSTWMRSVSLERARAITAEKKAIRDRGEP